MSPLKIKYSSHFSLIVSLLLQSFGFSSDHYSYDLELVIMISEIHALSRIILSHTVRQQHSTTSNVKSISISITLLLIYHRL